MRTTHNFVSIDNILEKGKKETFLSVKIKGFLSTLFDVIWAQYEKIPWLLRKKFNLFFPLLLLVVSLHFYFFILAPSQNSFWWLYSLCFLHRFLKHLHFRQSNFRHWDFWLSDFRHSDFRHSDFRHSDFKHSLYLSSLLLSIF